MVIEGFVLFLMEFLAILILATVDVDIFWIYCFVLIGLLISFDRGLAHCNRCGVVLFEFAIIF